MKKDFIILSLTMLGLFMSIGCNVEKQQVTKMQLFAVKYPGPFKILANQLDPCFNGVAKSDTVIHRDTTTIQGNTVTNTVLRHDTAFITKVTTLPGKTITINKKITDTVINDRQIGALQATISSTADSLTIVKAQLAVYKPLAAKFKLRFWLLVSGIILGALIFVFVKVYSFIYGGAAVGIVKKIL